MNHLFASYTFQKIQENIEKDNRFLARPLRHWRKAYQNSLGYSRASTGMPMDRPGGFVPVATTQVQCLTCRGAGTANLPVFNDSPCTSCQPITNKVQLAENKRFTDTSAYLQSRCVTYEQKLSTEPVPGIQYFSPGGIPLEPSTNNNGPQVRASANCFNQTPQLACNTTIYKPNNTQFAQQGGVSSSSRLARLKYNTLNGYGAEYLSATGAFGVNSGRYKTEPTDYFTKNKPQQVVILYKTGQKTYCAKAETVCPPPYN
jgi:hypothetical protein